MNQPAELPQFSTLAAFDHQPRTRIIFGVDTIERLGEFARELGLKKVLLVTDPGIVKAGHADRAAQVLNKAGLAVTVFSDVEENPMTRCVMECVEAARKADIDGFIAIGGGSAMDTAKGCNFILTNGGRMQDY